VAVAARHLARVHHDLLAVVGAVQQIEPAAAHAGAVRFDHCQRGAQPPPRHRRRCRPREDFHSSRRGQCGCAEAIADLPGAGAAEARQREQQRSNEQEPGATGTLHRAAGRRRAAAVTAWRTGRSSASPRSVHELATLAPRGLRSHDQRGETKLNLLRSGEEHVSHLAVQVAGSCGELGTRNSKSDTARRPRTIDVSPCWRANRRVRPE